MQKWAHILSVNPRTLRWAHTATQTQACFLFLCVLIKNSSQIMCCHIPPHTHNTCPPPSPPSVHPVLLHYFLVPSCQISPWFSNRQLIASLNLFLSLLFVLYVSDEALANLNDTVLFSWIHLKSYFLTQNSAYRHSTEFIHLLVAIPQWETHVWVQTFG